MTTMNNVSSLAPSYVRSMKALLTLLVSLALLVVFEATAAAQRRAYPPPLPGAFEIIEPRTRLEEFEARPETVLITGSSRVAVLPAPPGSVRVEAMEVRDTGNASRATGIVIVVRDVSRQTEGPRQPDVNRRFDFGSRALVDYEEIDPLIKALDTVAKADETITRHTRFDMRYRTRGDFEVIVFRQTTGGNAAAVSAGYFDKTTLLLTLDELTRLRHMIAEAKARLDELK